MLYTKDNINLNQISPVDFERLCYELLVKYGFTELTWRQGGTDNGRDIEGNLNFTSQLLDQKTKWFFECKHYTNGVPPEQLNSKIAWADAHRPGYLVIFVSSYITNGARGWLAEIQTSKNYKIIIIEGEELKERLIKFSDLIERFFSQNKYEQLFIDIKKHFRQYSMRPGFEVLKEIAQNIDPKRLELADLGFIFFNFYEQYEYFENRNDYFGDFSEDVLKPLYPRLQELSTENKIESVLHFNGDYTELGGSGFIDDVENDENTDATYQYYTLHLSYTKESENWAVGHYLFFKAEGRAFEIFSIANSDFTTASRFIKQYSPDILEHLSINFSVETIEKILGLATEMNS